jgi:hypothetical protein
MASTVWGRAIELAGPTRRPTTRHVGRALAEEGSRQPPREVPIPTEDRAWEWLSDALETLILSSFPDDHELEPAEDLEHLRGLEEAVLREVGDQFAASERFVRQGEDTCDPAEGE